MRGLAGRLRRCRVCTPGLPPDSGPFRPLPGGLAREARAGRPAVQGSRRDQTRKCRDHPHAVGSGLRSGGFWSGFGRVEVTPQRGGGRQQWETPRSRARGRGLIAQAGCRGTPQGPEKGPRALTASSGLPGSVRGSAPNSVPPDNRKLGLACVPTRHNGGAGRRRTSPPPCGRARVEVAVRGRGGRRIAWWRSAGPGGQSRRRGLRSVEGAPSRRSA